MAHTFTGTGVRIWAFRQGICPRLANAVSGIPIDLPVIDPLRENCRHLSHRVPLGAWLIYRSEDDREHVDVLIPEITRH